MSGVLGKIGTDAIGLSRVCGCGVGLRWLGKVVTQFGACRREHNLQPADLAMGQGPFAASYQGHRAQMVGEQVISGLREIWVRDVYLNRGFLTIAPDAVVVDFGANMGNFTLLALAHGPGVRVVSVEPSAEMRVKLERQLETNGWRDRVKICPHFVGGSTKGQEAIRNANPDAQFLTEDQFIQDYKLDRIDLMKCDIEGSEFELLGPQSRLLGMTRQLAIELHAWAGNMDEFERMLQTGGFETAMLPGGPDDRIVRARRVRA